MFKFTKITKAQKTILACIFASARQRPDMTLTATTCTVDNLDTLAWLVREIKASDMNARTRVALLARFEAALISAIVERTAREDAEREEELETTREGYINACREGFSSDASEADYRRACIALFGMGKACEWTHEEATHALQASNINLAHLPTCMEDWSERRTVTFYTLGSLNGAQWDLRPADVARLFACSALISYLWDTGHALEYVMTYHHKTRYIRTGDYEHTPALYLHEAGPKKDRDVRLSFNAEEHVTGEMHVYGECDLDALGHDYTPYWHSLDNGEDDSAWMEWWGMSTCEKHESSAHSDTVLQYEKHCWEDFGRTEAIDAIFKDSEHDTYEIETALDIHNMTEPSALGYEFNGSLMDPYFHQNRDLMEDAQTGVDTIKRYLACTALELKRHGIYTHSDFPKYDDFLACSAQGDNAQAVLYYLDNVEVKVSEDDARAFLSEYGAWTEEQLANHEDNIQRIVWLAAHNINEDGDFCFDF